MGSWKRVASLIVIVGVSLVSFQGVEAQRRLNTNRKAEQDALNSILNEDYDSRINPGGNDTISGPTVVKINMYVRSIDEVDPVKQQMKVQLTFRREWTDNRLTFTPPRQNSDLKYLTVRDTSKVWTPDLFFSHDKEAKLHDFTQLNEFIRIFPNGDVLASQRVSLTVSCPMTFRKFPLDTQNCSLRLASYSHATKDIILEWRKTDPVQMTSQLNLPLLKLSSYKTDSCSAETITGVYSCLRVDFEFKRVFNYYLIQVFIPCTMLIIMSWLCFWLDSKSVVARMTLAVTSLALMVINVSRLNESFPKVSYTKAIDTWTGICMTFVFYVVCETVLANYWSRVQVTCGRKSTPSLPPEEAKLMEGGDEGDQKGDVEGGKKQTGNFKSRFQKCWSQLDGCSQKVDFVSSLGYPILFVLFVIVFFGSLCLSR